MMSANISLSVADWKTSFSLNYVNNNPEGTISDANESSNKSLTDMTQQYKQLTRSNSNGLLIVLSVMIWEELIRITTSFTV